MSNPDGLRDAAAAFLHVPVLAAGVFGLADDYAAITLGGAAAAVAADAVGVDDPVGGGVAAAAGIHVAREANAAAHGLAVRMIVAVTDADICLLGFEGGVVTREYVRFRRETTRVQVTKFGASRRVHLADEATGASVEVTGSTGFLSSESAADKTVLALLV